MTYGFTFNGKHSSEFGLYVKTNTRTLKAEEKFEKEDLQLRNGSHTFKTGYKDRKINLDLTLLNCNYTERKQNLRKIAAWLTTDKRQPLIFDDELDILYMAQVNNAVDTNISSSATDEFSLSFDCDPFKYKTIPTINYIYLGDMLELGSIINLGVDNLRTFEIKTQEIIFNLDSTAPIENYVIELEGNMESIQINNMILNNVNGRFKIDLYNKVVYKINLDGSIQNRMVDFNKDWDSINYKQPYYFIDLIVTGLISQNYITFFFTDTYL